MSGSRTTKIVRTVRDRRRKIEVDLIADLKHSPFRYRLKWAWKILIGSKKPKTKRTRRARKRVRNSGQQGLTKDTKNINKEKRGMDG